VEGKITRHCVFFFSREPIADPETIVCCTVYLKESQKLWCHRIIEQFGLEVQPLCSEQGHLALDQVAQSPVQPGLECFQGWGSNHLSGQPVPVPHHPHYKNFLISSLNLPSFSLKPLRLVLLQQALLKSLSSSFLQTPPGTGSCSKVTPEPFPLQAEQPQLSQFFLPAEGFQPSGHGCGLLGPCSNSSRSVLR